MQTSPEIERLRTEVIRASNRKARLRRALGSVDIHLRDRRLELAYLLYGAPGSTITFKKPRGPISQGTVLGFEDDYIETNKICIVRTQGVVCAEIEIHISDPSLVVSHD